MRVKRGWLKHGGQGTMLGGYGETMLARSYTVAFEGIDPRLIEVQCALSFGNPAFNLVGLPDKAVSEARERVRAALQSLSIALPNKRITINLSPADLPKEGSHFDLPIALALLAALQILPGSDVERVLSLGELSLDGRLVAVAGALPAAMAAAEADRALICPAACGAEAAWVEATQVLAAGSLAEVVRHFTGQSPLPVAQPGQITPPPACRDLAEVKGQERAKRGLEIAAAGRHHLLMLGTPGSGKTMLAERLPGLLPPLSAAEALETSMIQSLAGLLDHGGISRAPPLRQPHHTATVAAMTGGGRGARPGEISLAHHGVLFLDELPEFPRAVLESLRQPIETGEVSIARANAHLRYPARFLLVAAANPCRCGYLPDAARACARAPLCGADYLAKISGPVMDRIDLRLELPPVDWQDLDLPAQGESSAIIARRVAAARCIQAERLRDTPEARTNADLQGAALDHHAGPDAEGRALIGRIAERMGLSARGYHRLLRVARTIADLEGAIAVRKNHIAEAASFRLVLSRGF